MYNLSLFLSPSLCLFTYLKNLQTCLGCLPLSCLENTSSQ